MQRGVAPHKEGCSFRARHFHQSTPLTQGVALGYGQQLGFQPATMKNFLLASVIGFQPAAIIWFLLVFIQNPFPMNHDFSNRLLLLPLFQGFSRLDFLDMAAKVPLDVRSLPAGSDIVIAGETSDALVCLLEGEAIATAAAPAWTYALHECRPAPRRCQPECR